MRTARCPRQVNDRMLRPVKDLLTCRRIPVIPKDAARQMSNGFGSFEAIVARTRLSIRRGRCVLLGSAVRWCQNDWLMGRALRLWLWSLRGFVWLDCVQQWRVQAAAAHRGGSSTCRSE